MKNKWEISNIRFLFVEHQFFVFFPLDRRLTYAYACEQKIEFVILRAREIHKCQEPTTDWRFLNFLIHDKRIYVAVSSTVSRQEMSPKICLLAKSHPANQSFRSISFHSIWKCVVVVVCMQIITFSGRM